MACAAEHLPQCPPQSAAPAIKKHTPARKRLLKRSRECGGNGKGVIHELMEAMLGGNEGYYYTAPNGVPLAQMSGKGSCVEVTSMSQKWMIVYREPDGVSGKS